ncbi:MAG TPA: hypothetical protein VHQ90_00100 [Thermoanaerobaculia bacterium]|nr:hypothetical protein [Thermoanaerobaculia bacterium]
MGTAIAAALIGAMGAILAALISRVEWRVREVSHKIDGLRNGTSRQAHDAIEELHKERAQREIMGLPRRRKNDHVIAEEPDQ